MKAKVGDCKTFSFLFENYISKKRQKETNENPTLFIYLVCFETNNNRDIHHLNNE